LRRKKAPVYSLNNLLREEKELSTVKNNKLRIKKKLNITLPLKRMPEFQIPVSHRDQSQEEIGQEA